MSEQCERIKRSIEQKSIGSLSEQTRGHTISSRARREREKGRLAYLSIESKNQMRTNEESQSRRKLHPSIRLLLRLRPHFDNTMTSISFLSSKRTRMERIKDRRRTHGSILLFSCPRWHCRREMHVSLSLSRPVQYADVASSWLRMQQYRAVSRLVCILLLLLRFSSSIE